MQTAKQYDQWEKLYKCIDGAPLRYPVHLWRYRHSRDISNFSEMDLWPIIKSQFLLRCANFFHTETGPARVTLSEEVRNNANSPFIHSMANSEEWLFSPPSDNHHKTSKDIQSNYDNVGFGRAARGLRKLNSDAIFFGAGICNYKIGSYFIQNHLDPIRISLENLGIRTATLLTDVSSNHDSLNHALLGGTYGFQESFNYARNVYSNIPLFDFATLPGFEDFLNEVSQIFPIESITSREIISSVIAQTYSTYKIFRDYFRIQKTKAVFLYAYYGIAGNAASLACREVGIPCFDIQHGVSGTAHESYSWPGSPTDGYNTIPNHFLCWTEEEAEEIGSHLHGAYIGATNIGHSWKLTENLFSSEAITYNLLNTERSRQIKQEYDALALPAGLLHRDDKQKNILVSLYTNEPIDWLLNLVANAPKSWKFFLRLHPGEAKNEESLLARQDAVKSMGIEVIKSSTLPVPIIMPEIDVVLNSFSSIVRDAWAYGVPSVCYSLSSKWYHNTSIFDGIQICEKTSEGMLSSIESCLANKSEESTLPKVLTIDELGKLFNALIRP